MVKLDILSDPICPWCYIGKANLDRALEQHGDQPFEIEWHPFQLNPDMPQEGMDRRTYLETKFGGKEQAAQHARQERTIGYRQPFPRQQRKRQHWQQGTCRSCT